MYVFCFPFSCIVAIEQLGDELYIFTYQYLDIANWRIFVFLYDLKLLWQLNAIQFWATSCVKWSYSPMFQRPCLPHHQGMIRLHLKCWAVVPFWRSWSPKKMLLHLYCFFYFHLFTLFVFLFNSPPLTIP
jgi:hypothetical protein